MEQGCRVALFRHEGHNGYVINDIYGIVPHYGIYQNMAPWLAKYQPDVIFLMLGTNDIGLTWQEGDLSKIDVIAENWKGLVRTLQAAMPENSLVVAGAVPPIKNSEIFNSWAKKLNANIRVAVKELSSGTKEVVFADVNGAVMNNGLANSFCSDGGHFNTSGYTAVANAFFGAFSSSKTFGKILTDLEKEKMPETVPESAVQSSEPEEAPDGKLIWGVAAGLAVAAAVAVLLVVSGRKRRK